MGEPARAVVELDGHTAVFQDGVVPLFDEPADEPSSAFDGGFATLGLVTGASGLLDQYDLFSKDTQGSQDLKAPLVL